MDSRHLTVNTSLGEVTLVATGDAITGVYFPHHWYKPSAETFGERVNVADDALLANAAEQLCDYLAGTRTDFDVPLSADGDPFEEQVWTLLTAIPSGETTTYGALAEQLGDKALAQRVGKAVGRNPLSVFIPCHRVVGSNGSLTGYAGGLKRKRMLLDLEETVASTVQRLF